MKTKKAKPELPPYAKAWNKRNPRMTWKSLSTDEKVIIRQSWQLKHSN